MNVQAVFGPDFDTDLTNRLDERLRLDIADRAADFGDDDVGVDFFADVINKLLFALFPTLDQTFFTSSL